MTRLGFTLQGSLEVSVVGSSKTGMTCSAGRSSFRHPHAQVIQLALNLAESCPDAYLKARPDVRKLWNQAFFWKILVVAGPSAQDEVLYEEPFASLLDSQEDVGSHNSRIVDLRGVEPLTSPVRAVRKASTVVYGDFRQRTSTHATAPFPITSASIGFRVFPCVMLGVC